MDIGQRLNQTLSYFLTNYPLYTMLALLGLFSVILAIELHRWLKGTIIFLFEIPIFLSSIGGIFTSTIGIANLFPGPVWIKSVIGVAAGIIVLYEILYYSFSQDALQKAR